MIGLLDGLKDISVPHGLDDDLMPFVNAHTSQLVEWAWGEP